MAQVTKAVIGQAISEFTKPIVEKIVNKFDQETIDQLNNMKIPRLLKIGSMIFTSIFPSESIPFGDNINEFSNELTSEFGSAIETRAKGESIGESDDSSIKNKVSGGRNNFFSQFLDPKLIDSAADRFEKLAKLLKGKTDKEKEIIIETLSELSLMEILGVLEYDLGQQYLDLVVKKIAEKKDPKTTKKVISELKEKLGKFKKHTENLIEPVIKPIDKFFGNEGNLEKTMIKRRNKRKKGVFAWLQKKLY